MKKNTSISLCNNFESFESNLSTIGVSKSDLLEEENKLLTLRNAISDGMKSGRSKNFNAKAHLMILKADKRDSL